MLVSIVAEHGDDAKVMHEQMFNTVNSMRVAMDEMQVNA